MIKNALRIGRLLALSSLLSAAFASPIAADYAKALVLAQTAGFVAVAPCCAAVAEEAIAEAALLPAEARNA